jgi:hypothetical protein
VFVIAALVKPGTLSGLNKDFLLKLPSIAINHLVKLRRGWISIAETRGSERGSVSRSATKLQLTVVSPKRAVLDEHAAGHRPALRSSRRLQLFIWVPSVFHFRRKQTEK